MCNTFLFHMEHGAFKIYFCLKIIGFLSDDPWLPLRMFDYSLIPSTDYTTMNDLSYSHPSIPPWIHVDALSTYIPPLVCHREVKGTKGEVISNKDLEVLLDRSNMMGESAVEPAPFYRAEYNR